MASPPQHGGSRHVGRVIDPAVREDGELEPAVELEPVPGPHPGSPGNVRDELVSAGESEGDSTSERGVSALGELGRAEHEPTRTSTSPPPRAPSAPLPPAPRRGQLTLNQRLLFTTLLGVATVASLIALAANLDPLLGRGASKGQPTAPAKTPLIDALEGPRPKRVRQKLPGPWRIENAKDAPDTRILDGQVKSQAFLVALQNAGVPRREAYRILTSMKGVREFERCKRSDRFRVLVDRKGLRVRAFEYIVGPGEIYQSREGEDGLLRGAKLDLAVSYAQVTGVLVYDGSSFDASADYAGFDPGLRRVVEKALTGHLELDELERGDRLRIVAQEMTVLGDFDSYTGIEAIEVLPAGAGRKPLRVYYFDHPLERGHYDSDGQAPYEGGWRKPVKDARVTSSFNKRRLHPILKRVRPHLGIDFAAPPGTRVTASAPGIVSYVGRAGPTGNFVRIDHSNQIQTGYAHLSRFAEGLRVGDRVKRQQVIGYVGTTGRSTGPHLHFSAKRNDVFIDPAKLRLDGLRTLSRESRAAFTQLKTAYDRLLDSLPLPGSPRTFASSALVRASTTAGGALAAASSIGSVAESDSESDLDAEEETNVPNATSDAGKSMVQLTDQELLELSGDAGGEEIAE